MASDQAAKRARTTWGEGPLYLGFDLSTQSCKALVIDGDLVTLAVGRVHFDTDLPHYRTADGCHRAAGGHVTSPVLMWVEALELALDRLRAQGCPFDRIAAVSGSGQQHGSVYWSGRGVEALRALDPCGGPVVDQLRGAFALEHSPIWMDTSTTQSCRELTSIAGGALAVAGMTGSTAQERFSGHFIRRFVAERGLAEAGAVSLVSSLGASLLVGDVVPIDASDGAGMNLMDIRSRRWHPTLLEFVAPGQVQALRGVLAEPQPPWEVSGAVHGYWAKKFGFTTQCQVIAWSGDNPCAVVGNGLVRPGDIAISLGTSDTALSVLPRVPDQPLPFGHLFPHPMLEGCYWSMLCYTNGDVTRRKVRDEFFADDGGSGDWGAFSQALRETPPGNNGAAGLFFSTDEITPAVSSGPDLRVCRSASGGVSFVEAFPDVRQNARAVIEMRALAIRSHVQKLIPDLLDCRRDADVAEGGECGPQLLLTGGASGNADILQVFADVFQRPVRCMDSAEGAAFGAAVRALHGTRPEAAPSIFARLRSLGAVRARPAVATPASPRKRPAAAAVAGGAGAAPAGTAGPTEALNAYAALEAEAIAKRGRM